MSNENLNNAISEILEKIDIKGNDYVKVHTRIKAFRLHLTDDYSITTNHTFSEKGVYAKCEIKDKDGRVIANGSSMKKSGAYAVEKTETAAVGRALAFLGIGIDDSVASSDEMQDVGKSNTENNTPPPPAISKMDIDRNEDALKQIETLLPSLHNRILPIVEKRNYSKFLQGISGQVRNWIKDNTNNVKPYLDIQKVNKLEDCNYMQLVDIVNLIQIDNKGE